MDTTWLQNPKERSRRDIMRDCRALNFVHSWDNALTSTSDVLRRRCHLRQERRGDAGQFKKVDNDVIEARLGAVPLVRIQCVSAKATPAAMEEC